MEYTVYDSSVSSYYQNFMYTRSDWLVFDVSDTQTVMLIGSFEVNGSSITGNTSQVVTITTGNYSSTPTINITDVDNREDTVYFTSSTSYRIVSNIEDAPTQRNSTYETSYKTYDICLAILVALVFAFVYEFIRGFLVWRK